MRRTWSRLLEGSLRDRALETVDAIARDLAVRAEERSAGARELASTALLFAYRAASCVAGDAEARRAIALVERACDALAEDPGDATLHGGFTGIAWMVEHVERILSRAYVDRCASVDEALLELTPEWKGTFDLMHGIAGLGVYALERGAAGEALLEAVLQALRARVLREGDTCAWWTRPEWILPSTAERFPDGYLDLGVAHGTPGLVSFLARASARGADVDDLLEGAARWTLAQTRDGSLPKYVANGAPPAIYAWCYGAPGVAASMAAAACTLRRDDWRDAAVRIARDGIRLASERSTLDDAALCHGAVGIAHVYHRIAAATGEGEFAEVATAWYARALSLRGDRGIGGYESYVAIDYRRPGKHWATDASFLTGAAGIALGLLSAATPVPPRWDRLLAIAPDAEATDIETNEESA